MPTPTQDPNMSSAEKLGIDGITLENIESVEFSYTKEEGYTLFRTTDPECMQDIVDYFSNITLSPPTESYTIGECFAVTFRFREIINRRRTNKITVITPTKYATSSNYYEVTEGAKTTDEWQVIMDACEKIKP